MPKLKTFNYFYLRYVPHATMDDHVTFGLVMLEDSPRGFAGVRFAKNWRRLLRPYRDADLEYFHYLEQDIRQRLSDPLRARELLARMEDPFAGSIQTSTHKQYLAQEPQGALEELARGTLDRPVAPPRRQSQRQASHLAQNSGRL